MNGLYLFFQFNFYDYAFYLQEIASPFSKYNDIQHAHFIY